MSPNLTDIRFLMLSSAAMARAGRLARTALRMVHGSNSRLPLKLSVATPLSRNLNFSHQSLWLRQTGAGKKFADATEPVFEDLVYVTPNLNGVDCPADHAKRNAYLTASLIRVPPSYASKQWV